MNYNIRYQINIYQWEIDRIVIGFGKDPKYPIRNMWLKWFIDIGADHETICDLIENRVIYESKK